MDNQQKIPFFTAVFMSVNIMVGAGLYGASDIITSIAGNASFISWIIVAALYLPMVFSITRLAIMIPGPGGFYRYTCKALGQKIGFLSGWLYFLCYLMACATVISALRGILAARTPNSILLNSPALFSALILSLIVPLNLVRLTLIGKIQKYLTVAKLIPALIVFVFTPFFFKSNFAITPSELKAAFSSSALTMALFGFLGFEFACNLSHQIEGGAKKTAKVIMTAFIAVAIIFTLFHFGLLQIMGSSGLVQYKAAGFAPFIGTKFPILIHPLHALVGALMTLCFFNSSNGILTLCSALLHSVAEDKTIRFSGVLSKLNSENRPWIIISLSGLLIFTFGALIPNTLLLGNACNFAMTLALSIALFSLLLLQIKVKHYMSIPITVLSVGIAIFLLTTRIQAAGTTVTAKFLTLSPVLIGMIVGLFLMKTDGACPIGPDRVDELLEKGKRRDIAP